MVELIKIGRESLRCCVEMAFKGDVDLMCRYHIVKGTLSDCVNDTVRRIDEVGKDNDLCYFGVYLNKTLIGFTVTGEAFLLSFGIQEQYRVKEVLVLWWKKVCEALNHEFVTWIFKKNTRAISFLLKNGMEIVDNDPTKDFFNLTYVSCLPRD